MKIQSVIHNNYGKTRYKKSAKKNKAHFKIFQNPVKAGQR